MPLDGRRSPTAPIGYKQRIAIRRRRFGVIKPRQTAKFEFFFALNALGDSCESLLHANRFHELNAEKFLQRPTSGSVSDAGHWKFQFGTAKLSKIFRWPNNLMDLQIK